MINTGGRAISQDKASAAIAQRLYEGMGDIKYANITDDTISINQYRDDSGQVITAISVSDIDGAIEPIKIFTFTLDELEKGRVKRTKDN